jgi:membrane-associated phospholipid phosphatase
MLLMPHAGHAQEKLSFRAEITVPVTLSLSTGLVLSEVFKEDLVSTKCRWCARNPFDEGARNALRWHNTGAANLTSYVTAFALVPLSAYGLAALAGADRRSGTLGQDAMIVTEATVAALALDQAVKFIAVRERPFVRTAEGPLSAESRVSFFSGHTTLAFALATSAGTVAQMRGYRMAPVVWATTLPMALLSGYLRIAADKHYATDVLVGMLVGSLFGVGLPLLAHRR